MNDLQETQETEEQAAARLRRVRSRKALSTAPEVAYQLRWDGTPLDGRTERGWLPGQSTPLLTGITDAADELYVALHSWVTIWAMAIEQPAPAGWLWRDAIAGVPLGFRAGTDPETASNLVRSASAWLLWHETEIDALAGAPDYQDAVTSLVWDLRAAAGLIQVRQLATVSETSTRPCPVCGELQVRAEYFSEPLTAAVARGEQLLDATEGISVRCAHCGWSPERTAAGKLITSLKIARWLS